MLRNKLQQVLQDSEEYHRLCQEINGDCQDDLINHPGNIQRILTVKKRYGSAESYGWRIERLIVGVYGDQQTVDKISESLYYMGIPQKLKRYAARYFGTHIVYSNLEWLSGSDVTVKNIDHVPPRFEMLSEDFFPPKEKE